MKNYFKNIFSKDCSWIEYLSFGISLFMLIVSIAYLIINPGELKIEDYSRTFAFIMFLIGSLIGIISFFVRFKYINDYAPLVSVAFYSVGCGRQLYLACYPLADLMTGVNWFGGNLGIYLTFLILFLIGTITEIVVLFFPGNKK